MKVHELVSDDLWALVEPLLPPHPAQPKGGNRWCPDRPALYGSIFVLQTGMRWNDLPLELGCGSGATCWRRLRDWQIFLPQLLAFCGDDHHCRFRAKNGSPTELVVGRRPRPDGVPDPHPDDRTARGRRAAWSRRMVGGPRTAASVRHKGVYASRAGERCRPHSRAC